jgi:hypothetical protein
MFDKEAAFKCKECSQAYFRLDDLKLHEATAHGAGE